MYILVAWSSPFPPQSVMPSSQLTGGCVGAFLLTLALLLFLTGLKPKRSGRFLSFSNEQGAVNISTDAIAEYIGKLAPEFPSIVKLTPLVGATT